MTVEGPPGQGCARFNQEKTHTAEGVLIAGKILADDQEIQVGISELEFFFFGLGDEEISVICLAENGRDGCSTRLEGNRWVEALRWVMQRVLPKRQGMRSPEARTWKKRGTRGKTPLAQMEKERNGLLGTMEGKQKLRIGARKKGRKRSFGTS